MKPIIYSTVFYIVSFLLVGCGGAGGGGGGSGGGGFGGGALVAKVDPIPTDPSYITDGTFEAYIRTFSDQALVRANKRLDLSRLRIIFGDTGQRGSRVIGFCQFLNNGENLIVVNQNWWNTANDEKREEMLYHEMGHCVLYRAHKVQFRTDDFSPISIMYSFLLNTNTYVLHYNDYLNELFNINTPAITSFSAGEEDGGIPWNVTEEERSKVTGVACDITLEGQTVDHSESHQHQH